VLTGRTHIKRWIITHLETPVLIIIHWIVSRFKGLLRLSLTSSLKSVLLLLNRLIAPETLEIEIHRGSFLKRTLLGLGRDGDIHAPDHVLLGVRQIVRVQRIDDVFPGMLIRPFASIRLLLPRLIPTGL
jgi:hypothetical protein